MLKNLGSNTKYSLIIFDIGKYLLDIYLGIELDVFWVFLFLFLFLQMPKGSFEVIYLDMWELLDESLIPWIYLAVSI